jgi:succinoglycan biosynthesis protein ExoA
MRWLLKAGSQKTLGFCRSRTAGTMCSSGGSRRACRSPTWSSVGGSKKQSTTSTPLQTIDKSLELASSHFYEFGAGWDLLAPPSYYVFGVERQTVVDNRPNIRLELVNDALTETESRPHFGSRALSWGPGDLLLQKSVRWSSQWKGFDSFENRRRGDRRKMNRSTSLCLPAGQTPALEARRNVKRISIIVPMFNEVAHIENLVADLAAQDFRGDVEVIVADGRSTDGSIERLETAAAHAHLPLTVIENPNRWVSHGLNACIRRAKGDLLVRVDCHTRYPPDYIRKLAVVAEETDAMCVGGVVVPVGRTPTERAIACATASPFGGVHWTRHAKRRGRVEVDVVYCGAFRAEAFERVGFFDESLLRNQDDEFTLRLRRAGGKIVLEPSIRAFYTPRGSYRAAFRQYHQYGFWKVRVMAKHQQVVSARSLAPLAFGGSIAAFGLAGVRVRAARRLLTAELAIYVASAICFGVSSVRSRRESLLLLPRVVAVFPTYHSAYGIGLLRGALAATRTRKT